jgi:hypothetical protein
MISLRFRNHIASIAFLQSDVALLCVCAVKGDVVDVKLTNSRVWLLSQSNGGSLIHSHISG